MLESLHIRNIALIEEETVDFHPGFSVLTGETGAGKSIIIGALNFALGERVSGKEIIRTGAEKASVEAIFSGSATQPVLDLLNENEIESEDDTLILTRDLSAAGRSVCRVNGCVVSLSVLKQFGDLLVDIHGQHEHQSLLDSSRHRAMLDRFCFSEAGTLLSAVSTAYREAQQAQHALKKLDASLQDRERRLDMLNHQMKEIDAAQLQPDEEETLLNRKRVLLNGQKIIDALATAKEAFTAEGGISEKFADAKRAISSLKDYMGDYAALADRVQDAFYTVEDIADTVVSFFDNASFDPSELDEVEQRLELIHALERKYGSGIEDILAFRGSLEEEFSRLSDAEHNRESLAKAYEDALNTYHRHAAELSRVRQKASGRLQACLIKELADLGMPHASFEVALTPIPGELPSEQGNEQVEFLLSANRGEAPKPLVKVASGGEISRVMLAFKRALADSDLIPTMIFDEIDTGISGMIGNAVADKMQQIASDRQVVCITHLPQIAAAASHHYYVYKTETENKTVSGVKLLGDAERAAEIARIMGSNPTDRVALEHASLLMKRSAQIQ